MKQTAGSPLIEVHTLDKNITHMCIKPFRMFDKLFEVRMLQTFVQIQYIRLWPSVNKPSYMVSMQLLGDNTYFDMHDDAATMSRVNYTMSSSYA